MSEYLEIVKRRICWPNPDATCLQGGCMYCQEGRLRSMNVIRQYAKPGIQVRNRGNGKYQDARVALSYGAINQFFGRVDYKLSDGTMVLV